MTHEQPGDIGPRTYRLAVLALVIASACLVKDAFPFIVRGALAMAAAVSP